MATGTVAGATAAFAAPTITVTPSTSLADGQAVRVDGSGWEAGHEIKFCQFSSTALVDISCNFPGTTADDAGNFSVWLSVARWLNLPTGGQTDCADPATQCLLTAAYFDNQIDAAAELEFASQPRAITVTPDTGLVDGQTVRVDGSGWEPTHQIGFCEGPPLLPPDVGSCDNGAYVVATADSGGNFSSSLIIKRSVYVPSLGRPIDCADPATPCVVGAADVADVLGTAVKAEIGFAAPPPPTVLPGVASALEGSGGTSVLQVPVSLSVPTANTVTVPWTTGSTASANPRIADPATDYSPVRGTVTFLPGETAKAVSISVSSDALVEPDEWIVVSFNHPTNARLGGFYGLGFGRIANDDHAVVLPGGATVVEGDVGTVDLQVPVTLSNPSTSTVTVQWSTVALPAVPPRADSATDFPPASGTVTFLPGETAKTVSISVNGDVDVEPNEWIVVSFNHPTNAKMGGFYGLGFGVIINDD